VITAYGWSDALQTAFAPHAAEGLIPGRVTTQNRDLWTLATDAGELRATLAGRLMHMAAEGERPVVGDWVAISVEGEHGWARIDTVLPRHTEFSRRAAFTRQGLQVVAANVDTALLVASMNADLNPRRLERYLAAARHSGAAMVIVLTKADLCPDREAAMNVARAVAFDTPAIAVSAVTGEGLDALAERLEPGKTAALLGSSGVGKSTLVNALAGSEIMATGAIRENDAHGRHTTTHREIILLPSGALLLDTPGMRELGLIDADSGVEATFADIEALAGACRFRDCQHGKEPGCQVRAALESGALDEGRWLSFQKLRREVAHIDRKEDRLAQQAERRRWIAISKSNRARDKSRDRW